MRRYDIKYECNGKNYRTGSKACRHFKITENEAENRLTVEIDAAESIKIKSFQIIIPFSFVKNHKIFVNGYQSWTESREYFTNERMDGFSRLKKWAATKPFNADSGMCRAGDAFFCKYPLKKGKFFGYSYGYARDGDTVDLFASLNENCGYTIIRFDVGKSRVIIEKDLDGVLFYGKQLLADFVRLKGDYDRVFEKWFDIMGIKCRTKNKMCGYTTWYNYHSRINEELVTKDLEALSQFSDKMDIFQIDDGYQKHTGDWLDTDEKKFPKGMKHIADKIHSKNMLAGLWLAPFAATKDSFIYKEHPDWLIRHDNDRLYPAGRNWGGFYAVDFYNPDAAAYIKKVFDTVLNRWGYDMVKLDFLYAACIVPIHNKTRGQIMCEAMDFISECAGDKLVLACGVPLMPCFGKVDFCRVGADVALEWKYHPLCIREDVSTPNTVVCSVFRRGLNERAFLNDPDVFLLRSDNIKMTFRQRQLLSQINSIFGSLLFMSDNVSQYDSRQRSVFLNTVGKQEIKILKADRCSKDTISVEYISQGEIKHLKFNYKKGIIAEERSFNTTEEIKT